MGDMPVAPTQEAGSGSILGREYGVERIDPKDRTFKFWDYVWVWFGAGINTGSWYFGGVFATFGLLAGMAMGWGFAPLIMVPWALPI